MMMERVKLRRSVAAFLLLGSSFFWCLPVGASVTVRAAIDQSIYVTFEFGSLNSTICDKISDYYGPPYYLFNDTTFPQIAVDNLNRQGLTRVRYHSPSLDFNHSARWMNATFYLSGWDILSFTYNKATMARIYQVRTDWRKFYISITDPQGDSILSLDFTKYFEKPVDQWKEANYTFKGETRLTYYHNYTGTSPVDPLCLFMLPATATNVNRTGDVITYELPPALGDVLLNSPFLILGTLLTVNIIVFLYRRVRKE